MKFLLLFLFLKKSGLELLFLGHQRKLISSQEYNGKIHCVGQSTSSGTSFFLLRDWIKFLSHIITTNPSTYYFANTKSWTLILDFLSIKTHTEVQDFVPTKPLNITLLMLQPVAKKVTLDSSPD